MRFSTTDERWPYLPTLIWIATRSHELTASDISQLGFTHAERSLAPINIRSTKWQPAHCESLGRARYELFEKLKDGELIGLATRIRRKHERKPWEQHVAVSVIDATPKVVFPPPADRRFFDRLDHDKDGSEGLSLVEKFVLNMPSADTVDWGDLTFARADVLRLWSELPQVSAYREAVEIGPIAPSPEAGARIASAVREPRPSLDEVLSLLAPSGGDLVERVRAGHWLLEQAMHGRVTLSGVLAKPRDNPVFPLEAIAQKQPISEAEFDGSALDVSMTHPNALGAAIAVARYAEHARHPEAVRWFNVSVDRKSLMEAFGPHKMEVAPAKEPTAPAKKQTMPERVKEWLEETFPTRPNITLGELMNMADSDGLKVGSRSFEKGIGLAYKTETEPQKSANADLADNCVRQSPKRA